MYQKSSKPHWKVFQEVELIAPLADAQGLEIETRLPQFVGLNQSPVEAVQGCRVAVVGAGSVGRRIALHLARLGIDLLWIVDPGRFDDTANLITQEVSRLDINNESKAVNTGLACKGISPTTRVLASDSKVQDLDPTALADADCVFLATDNLAAEIEVAQICLHDRTQLIQASVHGESLVAQVRFVGNHDACGPCIICNFGSAEWEHVNQESTFRCGGPGESAVEDLSVMPTMSTSFLCSLAADLAVLQWTRHRLELGSPVEDTLLQYCGFTHRTILAPLKRNLQCRCEHIAYRHIAAPKTLEQHTLRQLSELAGIDFAATASSYDVGGMKFVESVVCCGKVHQVRQFAVTGQPLGSCSDCGRPMMGQPFYSHCPVSAATVMQQIDQPLREIGAAHVPWVTVRGMDHGVLLK